MFSSTSNLNNVRVGTLSKTPWPNPRLSSCRNLRSCMTCTTDNNYFYQIKIGNMILVILPPFVRYTKKTHPKVGPITTIF